MDPKPIVILNCRSQNTILPNLQSSLEFQDQNFELQILESKMCPRRLSQITDENKIYFFFDEDIELPSEQYLKNVTEVFKNNPALLVLGGKYLPHTKQTYLAKSYNSQIELWLFKNNKGKNLNLCQNLPGGVWVLSGKITKYLDDWIEPLSWAGEDTFSMRWLQNKGIKIYHHSAADVLHFPRTQIIYFCRRAYLQGYAREKFNLKSTYENIDWTFIWEHKVYWAGWGLHQFFVEIGSLLLKIKSLKPRTTPNTSPTA